MITRKQKTNECDWHSDMEIQHQFYIYKWSSYAFDANKNKHIAFEQMCGSSYHTKFNIYIFSCAWLCVAVCVSFRTSHRCSTFAGVHLVHSKVNIRFAITIKPLSLCVYLVYYILFLLLNFAAWFIFCKKKAARKYSSTAKPQLISFFFLRGLMKWSLRFSSFF